MAIPLAPLRGATQDPGIAREPTGIRVGGTHVAGVICGNGSRTCGSSRTAPSTACPMTLRHRGLRR